MKSATANSTVSFTAPPQLLYEFQPRTLVARGAAGTPLLGTAPTLLPRVAAHASSSSAHTLRIIISRLTRALAQQVVQREERQKIAS